MDVVLQTYSDDPYLAFLDVKRFGDGSGFCAQLVVRSHRFSGSRLFCVEPERLQQFVAHVRDLDRDLRGTARLQPVFEQDYVELEVGHTGAVIVRGEMFAYAEQSQYLRFEFRTDQTCLKPLIADLQACFDLAAA